MDRQVIYEKSRLFSKEQIDSLFEMDDLSNKEATVKINEQFDAEFAVGQVTNFRIKYDLPRPRAMESLGCEHKRFIIDNARKFTNAEMAKEVNRIYGKSFIPSQIKQFRYLNKLPPADRRGNFTKEQQAFIENHATELTNKELAELFNQTFDNQTTPDKIRYYCTYKKISRPKVNENDISRFRDVEKDKLLNSMQEKFGLENARNHTNKELAELMNQEFGTSFTEDQIKGCRYKHKWPKSIKATNGRFKIGSVPKNKGTVGIYYRNEIGHEITTATGQVYVKVSHDSTKPFKERWKRKSELSAIEAGLIDKEKNVRFVHLDGDKSNNDISNLVLMTHSEMCYLGKLNKNIKGIDKKLATVLMSKILSKTKHIKLRNSNVKKKAI